MEGQQIEMIPLDGSPSQAALDIFRECIPDEITLAEQMLRGGMTPEAICSYAAREVPEDVYDLMLSAMRQLEINLGEDPTP